MFVVACCLSSYMVESAGETSSLHAPSSPRAAPSPVTEKSFILDAPVDCGEGSLAWLLELRFEDLLFRQCVARDP